MSPFFMGIYMDVRPQGCWLLKMVPTAGVWIFWSRLGVVVVAASVLDAATLVAAAAEHIVPTF